MEKKIPMRQCLGCREMRPKRELMRVVRSPEGEIGLDFRGKAPGRGAYVCRDVQCLKKAIKARALERALSVQIPPEIYERLDKCIGKSQICHRRHGAVPQPQSGGQLIA